MSRILLHLVRESTTLTERIATLESKVCTFCRPECGESETSQPFSLQKLAEGRFKRDLMLSGSMRHEGSTGCHQVLTKLSQSPWHSSSPWFTNQLNIPTSLLCPSLMNDKSKGAASALSLTALKPLNEASAICCRSPCMASS